MPDPDPETVPCEGAARRPLAHGGDDLLIREEPLLICIGAQQVLTMRTPGDDFHLAVGFLLSEGVLPDAAAVTGHHFAPGDPGALRADRIDIEVETAASAQVTGRLTRTHEIRSSCGICGLTDPDELLESTTPLLPGVPRLRLAQIEAIRRDFDQQLPLFGLTGASHGAVLYTADGIVLGRGEDVGRHNALDKALGMAAVAGHDLRQAVAVLSGRAGYDLTMKCLRLGIPVLLSVSAASALSVDLCAAAGGTLVGFLRAGRLQIYCDSGRITDAPTASTRADDPAPPSA